jgi:hypothetical protein
MINKYSTAQGHSNTNSDTCDVTRQITKRCRSHDTEKDNSSDKHFKGDVESEIDDLDNILSNIEGGENLLKGNFSLSIFYLLKYGKR